MAKNRFINTKFWSDSWIVELDHIERYLFLYLLTNEHTNICGIYELPLVRMAQETGIDKEMLPKILKRFFDDRKVYFTNGWVYIKNFSKHQRSNESVRIGIENAISTIPEDIIAKIKQIDTDWVQTVGDCDQSELKLKLKLESKPKCKVAKNEFSRDGVKIIEKFISINPSLKYGNKTQRRACDEMIAKFGLEKALSMVDRVLSVQGVRYAPTATTPYAMWTKIADFAVFFNKNKDKNIDL